MRVSTLYKARIRAGLAQAELAAQAGVHQTTVSRAERGGTRGLRTLARLAAALQAAVAGAQRGRPR